MEKWRTRVNEQTVFRERYRENERRKEKKEKTMRTVEYSVVTIENVAKLVKILSLLLEISIVQVAETLISNINLRKILQLSVTTICSSRF